MEISYESELFAVGEETDEEAEEEEATEEETAVEEAEYPESGENCLRTRREDGG